MIWTLDRKIIYGGLAIAIYMTFVWLLPRRGADVKVPKVVHFTMLNTGFHRDILSDHGGVFKFKPNLIKKYQVLEWWIDGPSKTQYVTTEINGGTVMKAYDNEGNPISDPQQSDRHHP